MIGQVALFLVILVSLLYATLCFLIRINFKRYETETFTLPTITVLLPCRNEAGNLPACLRPVKKWIIPPKN